MLSMWVTLRRLADVVLGTAQACAWMMMCTCVTLGSHAAAAVCCVLIVCQEGFMRCYSFDVSHVLVWVANRNAMCPACIYTCFESLLLCNTAWPAAEHLPTGTSILSSKAQWSDICASSTGMMEASRRLTHVFRLFTLSQQSVLAVTQ
jgi:hypothetical protein